MQIIKQSKQAQELAQNIINSGGIVVCPTDTVYGFLADASIKKAIEKIYKIKKRPKSKPLAVFVKDLKMAHDLAEIAKGQEKILKLKWPGKYTFILKTKNILRTPGVCKNGTIALRIPKYKFLNDLLKKINRPIAQTSVNISGQPALTKIEDIIKKFGGSNPAMLIINAGNAPACRQAGKSKPSKIIDLTGRTGKVLRY